MSSLIAEMAIAPRYSLPLLRFDSDMQPAAILSKCSNSHYSYSFVGLRLQVLRSFSTLRSQIGLEMLSMTFSYRHFWLEPIARCPCEVDVNFVRSIGQKLQNCSLTGYTRSS